jgi:hypothetical protein
MGCGSSSAAVSRQQLDRERGLVAREKAVVLREREFAIAQQANELAERERAIVLSERELVITKREHEFAMTQRECELAQRELAQREAAQRELVRRETAPCELDAAQRELKAQERPARIESLDASPVRMSAVTLSVCEKAENSDVKEGSARKTSYRKREEKLTAGVARKKISAAASASAFVKRAEAEVATRHNGRRTEVNL